MDLFFVSRDRVRRQLPTDSALTRSDLDRLDRFGIRDSTGIVLDAHMRPVEPITTYLREMAREVGSRTSREYSLDLFSLMRYLDGMGTTLMEAGEDELQSYKQYRLERQTKPVARSTWNRNRVAIEGFFEWAVDNGHRPTRPYRARRSGQGTTLSDRLVEEPETKHLTLDQWLYFRDVGLGGALPDGNTDWSYLGRTTMRNTAGAELAMSTGMRIQEWSSLLDVEVPLTRDGTVTVWLEACAKGRRPRRVTARDVALRRIDLYRETERAELVALAAPRLATLRDELFVVTDVDFSRRLLSGILHGRSRKFVWDRMAPDLRKIAVTEGAHGLEPMALFLGATGTMLSCSRWSRVLSNASDRASQMSFEDGGPLTGHRVTSHMFRHTFALLMLLALTQGVVESEGLAAPRTGMWLGYKHMLHNPLLRLQKLLGHARLSSTLIYLDVLDDTDAIVQEAFERWSLSDRTLAELAMAEEI